VLEPTANHDGWAEARGWREGWPDLLWRTVGRLLDANPPSPTGTRPHLNSAGPGVEVGGPQNLGDNGVARATTTTVVVIATIVVVAVLLLLAELLQLLLLRSLLVLLLSGRVFLSTGEGR
jgi:hypothetical protein